MDEPNVSPAENQPNADQRIAELEAKLSQVERAYSASSNEGKRLAQQLQSIQQEYVPRQQIPNRSPWEQKLEESAIPVDAIKQAIDERAEQLVQQKFQPLMRGIQARQTMAGRYKDYGKFEAGIGEMLEKNPEVQRTYNLIFQADPVEAFEYAYHRLGIEERGKRTRNNADSGDLVESQIPTNRSGDARRAPRGDSGAVEEAARAYRDRPSSQTAQAYAKARLKTAIPDEFLNQ